MGGLLKCTAAEMPLSPTALAAGRDGKTLFVACATANQVLRVDISSRKVVACFETPNVPTGLSLSADGSKLAVTCAGPESKVLIIETADGEVVASLAAGHTAMAPVFSPDGQTVLVCNRFNHDVSVLDLSAREVRRRLPVQREPVASALTRNGRYLLVANLLHNGAADADNVAAVVSVLDVAKGVLLKELRLPIGSGSLNDIALSPDGKYAFVSHLLSRYPLPATQLDRGWMNTNAGTLIDVETLEVINTVLLDSVDSGAANPWGVAWSSDSATLAVAHAGTHEVSVIDFPALRARLAKIPATPSAASSSNDSFASRCQADVPNDLSFLVGLRHRVRLPNTDRGPRAIAFVGSLLVTANYFSDTLSIISEKMVTASIALAEPRPMTLARKGEFYFHDASICFQGWQSCASCHPGDARMDALNWDLLNDGTGNPKNNKSLLLVHRTPPAMSLGVRETAEMAVRAGIRHILFTEQPAEVADSMDEYLKSLRPVPSPNLVNGKLSPAAERGQKIFQTAGCADCHPPGLFTDLNRYDVGTRGQLDRAADQLDTPTLLEIWRTAPYLHDGSAVTVRDVVTSRNREDRHGKTSNLAPQDIEDLCTYLNSL